MNNFERLGLARPLLDAITALGYETPTPIQVQAIPPLLSKDTDLVGLAQTGTGKTAAFGLPLIQMIDPEFNKVQGLILAPTRELCLQITNELGQYSKFLPKLKITPVYGGADIRKQMMDVKKGTHIIVATPGRLRDLMRRGVVHLDTIRYFILDEADEMLNMGFKEEIDEILKDAPENKNTWLFSATMPPEVKKISRDYMVNPIEVRGHNIDQAHAQIVHEYVVVRPSERFEALKRFLDADENIFGLVFTRTRMDAKDLADNLEKDGYKASALHGDLSQSQRDRVMAMFRGRHLQVLIATDVAARGIDVSNITHVFHYNIPEDISFYTHRSGRTGRAGSTGKSIVFAHPNDKRILKMMEKKLQVTFHEVDLPSGADILKRHLLRSVEKVKSVDINGQLDPFMAKLEEEYKELSKTELIKRFTALTLGKHLKNYKEKEEKEVSKKNPNAKWVRLFINVGEMDVRDKGGFISMICSVAGITGVDIGKIDLQKKHSLFDVEESKLAKVTQMFRNYNLDGRPVRINRDSDGPSLPKKTAKKEHFKAGKFKRKR
jgi:ATP-dependent RNA helicase DeaD